jgi:hypothetical protein
VVADVSELSILSTEREVKLKCSSALEFGSSLEMPRLGFHISLSFGETSLASLTKILSALVLYTLCGF